jgi:hypothetical protein
VKQAALADTGSARRAGSTRARKEIASKRTKGQDSRTCGTDAERALGRHASEGDGSRSNETRAREDARGGHSAR